MFDLSPFFKKVTLDWRKPVPISGSRRPVYQFAHPRRRQQIDCSPVGRCPLVRLSGRLTVWRQPSTLYFTERPLFLFIPHTHTAKHYRLLKPALVANSELVSSLFGGRAIRQLKFLFRHTTSSWMLASFQVNLCGCLFCVSDNILTFPLMPK